jgi:hypothetical protein
MMEVGEEGNWGKGTEQISGEKKGEGRWGQHLLAPL